MSTEPSIRILFVETFEGNGYAAEMYIRSMNRKDILIKTVASADEIRAVARESWDVAILDTDKAHGKKDELEAKLKLSFGRIPIIDLGYGSGEGIVSGNTAQLEEYFQPVKVSVLALIRTLNHVLERRRLAEQVERLESRLAEIDRVDSATGVWTHDYILERVHELYLDWQRYKYPMTIFMIEIAEMDSISENFGFEIADKVVATFGKMIQQAKRSNDYAGRLGPAQFLVAFPSTPITPAMIGVERIRDALKRTVFSGKTSDNFTVGAYYGVIQMGDEHADFEKVMNAAAETLARSKRLGINQIATVTDPT